MCSAAGPEVYARRTAQRDGAEVVHVRGALAELGGPLALCCAPTRSVVAGIAGSCTYKVGLHAVHVRQRVHARILVIGEDEDNVGLVCHAANGQQEKQNLGKHCDLYSIAPYEQGSFSLGASPGWKRPWCKWEHATYTAMATRVYGVKCRSRSSKLENVSASISRKCILWRLVALQL